MPIPESLKNIKGNFSESIYIDFYDGEKPAVSSTGIMSASINPIENLSVSLGTGYTTNSENIAGVVVECKGIYNYDDNANVQLRVRSSHSPAVDKTQIRLSPGFKCNVAEKTTLYANPYLSANIDYRKEQCSLDYGFFAGVTQGIGKKVKISAEVQRYSNHLGANVITSINF